LSLKFVGIHRSNDMTGLGITGFFGRCPSFSILKSRKHNISETGSLSPLTWGRKQIQFRKRSFWYLEYRTMDKVRKSSNFVCYIPSSNPSESTIWKDWICRTKYVRYAYKILVGKFAWTNYFSDLSLDGRMILDRILEKEGRKSCYRKWIQLWTL
jgi:hypothetical protein